MDKIILKNIKLNVNIGLTEDERNVSQPILLTIIVYKNLADVKSISETVDYDKIYNEIIKYCRSKKHVLIETFGNELADIILNKYEIHKIKLTIKKPNAIEGADYAAVALLREKL